MYYNTPAQNENNNQQKAASHNNAYSSAERYSHINRVEETGTPQSTRYGTTDFMANRPARQGARYGYNAGKYAIKGGFAVGGKAMRMAGFSAKSTKDVMHGAATAREALNSFLKQRAASLKRSAKSEDTGPKALVVTKDNVVRTYSATKLAKSLSRSFSKGVNTTKKVVSKTYQTERAITGGGIKLFGNPFVLKGIIAVALLIAIFGLLMAIISSLTGIISALSLKSEPWELSQTYSYITELDANLEYGIKNEDTKIHIPIINEYHYYLNGEEVSKENMDVYTDCDMLLAFFDSKYEDYEFMGTVAGIFATTVKGEVEAIHQQLHQVSKEQWSYIGNGTKTIHCMDITLNTRTFNSYYEEYKDTLLTPDQEDQYRSLLEIGIGAFSQELSSPFLGMDWSAYITSGWGWRIHPISGEVSKHKGVDIGIPFGTAINACHAGTAVVPPYSENGYGNYVKLIASNGDYTLYAHMSSIAVADGQSVAAGEVIGYVGSTGMSTGDHLHFEYNLADGKNLYPTIFTDCEQK